MEIVRGFILPKRGKDNKPVYSHKIDDVLALELLNDYKELLKYIIETFIEFNKNKKINDVKSFNIFLNYLVLKIKSLLYLDPIPNIIPPPIIPEYYVEKISNNEQVKLYTYEGIEEYSSFLTNLEKIETIQRYLKIFEKNKEYNEKLFKILDFPADTRIGANTSSLIIHMLTVAGLASAMAIEEKLSEKDLVTLRLISLFHDIGKFKIREWYRHAENSAEILKQVFEPYIEGEAKTILDEACNLLSKEKQLERFSKILQIFKQADRIASSIDRLKNYFLSYVELSHEAKEILKYVKEFGKEKIDEVYDRWEFWERIPVETKVKLTEDFCKHIEDIIERIPSSSTLADVNLYLARIDLRSIQSFIKSNELRIINAGSRIVDILTYFGIPLRLIELGLPPECVLYFGGGNITLVIPEILKNLIAAEKFGNIIEISIGISQLYYDFLKSNEELELDLALKKLHWQSYKKVDLNIFKLCDVCGSRHAETEIRPSITMEKVLVCKICKRKFDIGSYLHFMPRTYLYYISKHVEISLEKRISLASEKISQILKDVPVYISGVSADKLGEAIEEYPNLSIIRFDGNIVGSFMASCISITDAHERSIRVDWSVKSAVHKFLDMLEKVGGKEDILRLVLGIMYLGGDDGALLMPSSYALPFALYLGNEFYLNTGCKLTLSIALISAKPKHPLIPLYESCGELLDEIVKSKCRDLAYKENIEEKVGTGFRGAVGFYAADGSFVLKESIENIFEELDKVKLSYQYVRPYVIAEPNVEEKLKNKEYITLYSLLKPILKDLGIKQGSIDELTENLLSKIINNRKETMEILKKIKRVALDGMQVTVLSDNSLEIKLLYTFKQAQRSSEKYVYNDLIENLFYIHEKNGYKKFYFNTYDLIMALKIIGGGEI
jgi:putative nucleotidyltransferase with HDIG domain